MGPGSGSDGEGNQLKCTKRVEIWKSQLMHDTKGRRFRRAGDISDGISCYICPLFELNSEVLFCRNFRRGIFAKFADESVHFCV